MPDNTNSPPSEGGERKRYYPLTFREWCKSAKHLKPAQLKVLYYLRTLDPFGGTWIDIQVTAIAEELGLDKSTVSRALKKLADEKDLELEIQTARVKLSSRGSVLPTGNLVPTGNKFPTDNVLPTGNLLPSDRASCVEATEMIARQHLNERSDLKAAQSGSSKNEKCTNRSNLLNKQNIGTTLPPSHPVQEEGMNRVGLGTSCKVSREGIRESSRQGSGNLRDGNGSAPLEIEIEELLQLLRNAGVEANKTIKKTIASLLFQKGSAATRQMVENSISSLKEQQKRGKVRNPGGFIVAALRRGFTSNEAKRDARERPQVPDLVSVEYAIDQALVRGDRAWALGKLQGLWSEGWHDQVEWLLQNRTDWLFEATAEGVK